jgi:hypothetical protein
MPQCQFPVFCCFCFSEKLHRKYSQNWMKQKPNLLFFYKRHEVRRWDGEGPEARLTLGWRGLPLARDTRGWDQLIHLLTPPFRLYIPLDRKNPKDGRFSSKHTASRRYRREIGRIQELFPAPCRREESLSESFSTTMVASGVMCE